MITKGRDYRLVVRMRTAPGQPEVAIYHADCDYRLVVRMRMAYLAIHQRRMPEGDRVWVIPSTGEFLAELPPGFSLYGTDQAAVCKLLEPHARELLGNAAATRAEPPGGPRNALIARWTGPPANRWNLTTLDLLTRYKLNLPRAARISALVNAALADSLYASW